MVLPGAVLTGVFYTAIQLAGARVTAALAKNDDTYGDIGSVLALLGWLSLHAVINLYGAELNAALHRLRNLVVEPDSPMLSDPPLADA